MAMYIVKKHEWNAGESRFWEVDTDKLQTLIDNGLVNEKDLIYKAELVGTVEKQLVIKEKE